jgi:hypothetical protein
VETVVARLASHGFQLWAIDHTRAGHRRAVTSGDARSLLSPLEHVPELGGWPHILCARHGLPALPDTRPTSTSLTSGGDS